MCMMLLGACSVFEQRINDPGVPTTTPIPFSTATPGGRISVMMAQTDTPNQTLTPVATVEGAVVGPAATATAAVEQIISATQTAAAPTSQPTFQPDNCPDRQNISAPAQPESFNTYAAVIGVYLSNGGAPSILESNLRAWGAITDAGGVVQADTDLTGDKIPEIMINIFNPTVYNPDAVLNAGQLLIFGCDNNGYRLLYSTPNNPSIALPVLHRVGDMNGDVTADVVFDTQSCTVTACTREGFILGWNPVVGAFEPLNNEQILAVNGRLGVVDIDSDGILELTMSSNTPPSAITGPTRSLTDVWDWTGQSYVFAVRSRDDPLYAIHQLHDADDELFAGQGRNALRGYFEIRNNPNLLSWSISDEPALLRAFATYRIIITYALNGDDRTEETLVTLQNENPEGTAGNIFVGMGNAFMEVFRSTGDLSAACGAALNVGGQPAISFLNSYGTANRLYTLSNICPF